MYSTVYYSAHYVTVSPFLLRREDAADLSDLDQEAVEKVANDIEEKLHNLYQEINPKYKNKYRSLLFNLKDMRNQVWKQKLKIYLSVFYFSRIPSLSSPPPPPPPPPPPLSLSLSLSTLSLSCHRGYFAKCFVVK